MQHFCTCDKIRAENLHLFSLGIRSHDAPRFSAALGAKMKTNTRRKSHLEIVENICIIFIHRRRTVSSSFLLSFVMGGAARAG